MNFDIAGLFDTLAQTLTDAGIPVDEIVAQLQPLLEKLAELLEPIIGSLM